MKQSNGLIYGLALRRKIAFRAPPAQHLVWLPLWNSHRLAPINNAKRDAFYLYEDVLALIAGLLVICGPPAVFGLIALIIVNSLDGMLWCWSMPHVFKEVHEITKPSIAYADTAPAISMVFFMVWIAASILYCTPNIVFGRMAQAMSFGVLFLTQKGAGGLLRKATAALGAFSDIRGGSYGHVPAVAFAVPHNVVRSCDFRTRHDKQASEAFSRKIKGFRHLDPSSIPNGQYAMDCGRKST